MACRTLQWLHLREVEACQVLWWAGLWREQHWERLQLGVKGRRGVGPPWAGVQGSGLGWSEQGAAVFGLYS